MKRKGTLISRVTPAPNSIPVPRASTCRRSAIATETANATCVTSSWASVTTATATRYPTIAMFLPSIRMATDWSVWIVTRTGYRMNAKTIATPTASRTLATSRPDFRRISTLTGPPMSASRTATATAYRMAMICLRECRTATSTASWMNANCAAGSLRTATKTRFRTVATSATGPVRTAMATAFRMNASWSCPHWRLPRTTS